jgi:hypothetical protein
MAGTAAASRVPPSGAGGTDDHVFDAEPGRRGAPLDELGRRLVGAAELGGDTAGAPPGQEKWVTERLGRTSPP